MSTTYENLKNHHIYKGKKKKKVLNEIATYTQHWSNCDILNDNELTHYSIIRKRGLYMFGVLNKKKHGDTMKKLGLLGEKGPSSQAFVYKHVGEDELTFFYWKEYKHSKCNKPHFMKLIRDNNYITEWIRPNVNRRVYFDLDGKKKDIGSDRDIWISLDNFIGKVNEKFKRGDKLPKIAVSGSYAYKEGYDEKYLSYHIVLPEFYFPNTDSQNKAFKAWAVSLGADSGVYGNHSKFKCINQKKSTKEADDRIQRIILDNDPIHAISHSNIFVENTVYHIAQLLPDEVDGLVNLDTDEWTEKFRDGLITGVVNEIMTTSRRQRENRGNSQIREIEPNNAVDIPTLCIRYEKYLDILDKFRFLTPEYRLPRQVWRNLVRWFIIEGGTYEEFISSSMYEEWINLHPTEPTTQAWWNNIRDADDSYLPYSRRQMEDILCRHYGVDYLKPRFLTQMGEQFLKRDETYKGITPTVVDGQYVTQEYINDAKYQLLCVAMGAGKTYLAIKYLEKMIKKNPSKTFCFITTRISQASGVVGRTKHLEVILYSDKKEKYQLRQARRLCIELESIHYVLGCKFDYLILDEFESLRESFKSDTCHSTNYTNNYKCFVQLIQKAEKVFVMDAYLKKWTIDWLQMIDTEAHPVDDFNLIMRCEKFDLIKKEVYIHKDRYIYNQLMADDLKAGKKIYVFYPYASGGKKKDIINFTRNLLERAGLKMVQGLYYFGSMSSTEKKKLSNVNKIWSICYDKKSKQYLQIKLIVVNSSVTVGVNLDVDEPKIPCQLDFRVDVVYLGYDDLLSARQCIQSSMRARHTKSPIIRLYHYPNFTKKDETGYKHPPPPRPCLEGDEPEHFKFFLNCIQIEHKANGINLLKMFMWNTGYTIKESTKSNIPGYAELCKRAYTESQANRTDIKCFDFEEVSDLSWIAYQDVYKRVNQNKSSFDDNLAVRKFNIQRHFTDKFKQACKVYWKKYTILESILILVYDDETYQRRIKIEAGYEREKIVLKDRDIRRMKNIYNKAIYYDSDDHEFKFQTEPLSVEDKKEIWESQTLPEVDKNFDYFKKRTDNIIRKRIINEMFGKSATYPLRESVNICFKEKWEKKYLLTALLGLTYINKTDKSTIYDSMFRGVCLIEDDDTNIEDEFKVKQNTMNTYFNNSKKNRKKKNNIIKYKDLWLSVDFYERLKYYEMTPIKTETLNNFVVNHIKKVKVLQYDAWKQKYPVLYKRILDYEIKVPKHFRYLKEIQYEIQYEQS